MANTEARIDVVVKGGSKLERLIKDVSRLESVVDRINVTPLDINVGRAESDFNAALQKLTQARKGVADAQKAYNEYDKTIKKLEKSYLSAEQASLSAALSEKKSAKEKGDALLKRFQAEKKFNEGKKERLKLEKALQREERNFAQSLKYKEEAKNLAKVVSALSDLSGEYLKLGRFQTRTPVTGKVAATQTRGTIAQLNAQAEALSLVAANSEIATRQFRQFTIASEIASQSISSARQEQFRALAMGLTAPARGEALSVASKVGSKKELEGARALIGEVIASYGGIVKSEAALSSYISQLRSLQSIVPFDTSEWGLLEASINEVNAELEQLQTRYAGLPRQGEAMLLPQFSVKSAAEKARYERDLASKQDTQIDKLIALQDKLKGEYLEQGEAVEIRNKFEKIASDTAEGLIDSARRQTVELKRQVKEIKDRNKALRDGTEAAVSLGRQRLREESKTEVTTEKIDNAREKLDAAAERINVSSEKELINEVQKKNLLLGLDKARLEIDQGRLIVAQTIVAETDRLRRLEEVGNRAKFVRSRGSSFAADPIEGPLKLRQKYASDVNEEYQKQLDLLDRISRSDLELAKKENLSIQAAQALEALMENRLEIAQEITKEVDRQFKLEQKQAKSSTVVERTANRIIRGGETLPVDTPRRVRNTLASGAIVEQGLINLQAKGVDVAEQLISLQKTLNDAKRDDFQISERTLGNLQEQVTLAGKRVTLENRRLAGKRGGAGDSVVTGFSTALSPAEIRKQVNQIYKDFDKAVAGNTVADSGADIGEGIAEGIARGAAESGATESGARALAKRLIAAYRKVFRMKSPSKETEEKIGIPIGQGIGKGAVEGAVESIEAGKAKIQAALKQLALPSSEITRRQRFAESAKLVKEIDMRNAVAARMQKLASAPKALPSIGGTFGSVLETQYKNLFKSATQILPAGIEPLLAQSISGQEFVIERFLESLKLATNVFNTYFNANSVLPMATRDLAAAMDRASTQLLLSSSQGAIAALPSSEMIRRQRLAESAKKAKEIDTRNAVRARMQQLASAPKALPPIGGTYGSVLEAETASVTQASRAQARQEAERLIEGAKDVFPSFSREFRRNANTLIPSAAASAAGEVVDQARYIQEPGVGLRREVPDYARRMEFFRTGGRRLTSAVSFRMERAPYIPPSGLGAPLTPDLEERISSSVRNLFERIRNSIESIRIPSFGGGFGGGGRGGGGGGAAGGAAPLGPQRTEDLQEALRNRRLGPIARATNEQLEELARRLQDIRNRADATGDEFRRLGRDLAVLGREQERRDPGAEFLTRRVGPRAGRAISEGLVGGAFPLLFGQGIGSSILGGLGGAAGGFAGGGLGFGLSLLGTALGSAIDETVQKSKTLGAALNESTADIDAIVESLGEVGGPSARLIKQLEEVAGKQAALEEATARLALIVGDDGVRALQEFGDASTELGNAVSKLVTGLLAEVARLAKGPTENFAGGLTALSLRLQATKSTDPRMQELVRRASNPKGIEDQARTFKEIEALQRQINEQADKELQNKINALSPINDALASEERRYKIALLGGDILKDEVMSLEKAELLSKLRQENQATLNKYLEKTISYDLAQKEFKKNQITYDRELLELENQRIDKLEDNIKKIQEFNEANAKSYRDMRLQIERQIEDERIAAARRIEDAELKGARAVLDFKEKGLQIIQNQRREQIELASAIRGLEAQFSANPSREGLAAQLSAAVDQYKNGLAEADENRKLAEEKIQLDAREAALAIERFKQDNARRVARINEESVRKIAEINEKIDKQRNESYKYAYDLTIQRLIAQEQAAANQLEQQKAGNEALLSSPFVAPDYKIAIEQEIRGIDAQLTAVEAGMQRLRRLQSQLPATPQLQNVGSLPVMTSQANEVSAAETRVNSLIQAGRERLLQLEQQNTKESAAAGLARQALQIIDSQRIAQTQITESLNKRIEDAQRYKQLLASGINPELARQMAAIEGASAKISDVIEMTIKQLEALDGSKFKKPIEALRGIQQNQPTIVSGQIDKTKKALELEKPTLIEGISAEINQLEKDLDPITVATNSIINGANAIGTAFGQAFTDVASGAKSTEQALADTFESIGKAFLGMAAEIIAKQLTMIALQTILKALGAVAGGASLTTSTGVSMSAGTATQSGFDMGSSLAGMFRANGGPVNANEPYIVGERGPELFMPSSSGMVLSNNDTREQLEQQDAVLRSNEATREQLEQQDAAMRDSATRQQLEQQDAAMRDSATRQQLEQQDAAMRGNEATRQQLIKQQNTMTTNRIREVERTSQAMLASPDPIDVRYESSVINNVEYVTAEQHRKGMAQAAERGRALTLQALQNSVKTRSRVGI